MAFLARWGARVLYSNGALRAGFLPVLLLAALVAMSGRPPAAAGFSHQMKSAATLSRPVVSAGGLIFVSGITSAPAGPGQSAAGTTSEIDRQPRAVLDDLRQKLSTASSTLGDVVSVTVCLRHASDYDAMNAIYRAYFPDTPPARTTVAADLPPGALIQISATAVPTGTSRIAMQPSNWAKTPRPYSYIVRTGDLVFISGLTSRRGTDDQFVPGPVSVQTRTILDNASTLLHTAGLSLDNVVAARVFLTDDGDFESMNEEYRKRFADMPPARATAVTGLMGTDAEVEIALVASTSSKETIGPLVSPTLPVSTAVRAGSRVFVSGVTGVTDTNTEDPTGQAVEALSHLKHALSLAGLTPADVVDTTVYVRRLSDLPSVDAIYGGIFVDQPPTRTVMGAKLVTRPGLVEIMATAIGNR